MENSCDEEIKYIKEHLEANERLRLAALENKKGNEENLSGLHKWKRIERRIGLKSTEFWKGLMFFRNVYFWKGYLWGLDDSTRYWESKLKDAKIKKQNEDGKQ